MTQFYKGMRLAREDRTKNRMPSLEWIENQKLLKKLRKNVRGNRYTNRLYKEVEFEYHRQLKINCKNELDGKRLWAF